ncbi:hypothetical protein BC834DRAFT_912542 [Gloeopeniophorella convolvens]|nr:hypothetical protein BC834DRAFT_912542 [Gloeopeniophorella convolvens]
MSTILTYFKNFVSSLSWILVTDAQTLMQHSSESWPVKPPAASKLDGGRKSGWTILGEHWVPRRKNCQQRTW